MRSTFLPFSTPTIEEAEINEVVDSLRSGWITTGPKVKRFEEAFRAYVGAPFAIPLSSATAGLHLTLLALGIKEGDEIITTPMTFASTVSMIILCGGTPVLADIEPGTLNIDVGLIRAKITPRTRAIIPVHFAGQSCDMDPLFALAREFNLTIIEDAAHAAGTEYKGRRIGSLDVDLDLLLPSQQEHHHRRGGHGLHRRRDPGRGDLAAQVPRHEPRGLEALCRQRHPQLRYPHARLQVQHDGHPGGHRHPPAAEAGRLHRPEDGDRRILQPGAGRYRRAGPAAVCPLRAAPRLAPLHPAGQDREAVHRPRPLHGGAEEAQHRQRPALQGHPPPCLVPRAPEPVPTAPCPTPATPRSGSCPCRSSRR